MLNSFNAVLIDKKQLTHDVYLFKFKYADVKQISFTAGQYFVLNIPKPDGELIKRIYSIASPPQQTESFELLIKLFPEGAASTYLLNLSIGDQVLFQGPAGNFKLKENGRNKAFLITGTGFAPIRSILLAQFNSVHHPTDTRYYLFWGLRTLQDVCFLDELKDLANKYNNFCFQICLSQEKSLEEVAMEDRKYFSLGHVDSSCEEIINRVANFTPLKNFFNYYDFYLCGGRQIIEFLRHGLLQKEVNPENIVFEKF